MKTGLILTGGRIELSFAGDFLRNLKQLADTEEEGPGCVIAVDGGLETAERLGLWPDAVAGDLDTVRADVLRRFRGREGIVWNVREPEKDETDTQLAVRTAMELGCGRLILLGATGGRLDHELSNIHLLKSCLDAGVRAEIYDACNRLYLLDGHKTWKKGQEYGRYVSFLPFTERVKGITLKGFKYPLDRKDIAIGEEAGLCVSNEIVCDEAEISFDGGILICVESKD